MKNDKLTFRSANSNDMDLLYSWRNEKSVRENSYDSSIISFKDHKKWFKRKLNDTKAGIFILEMNNIPVGTVRFEKGSNEYSIVSIIIAKIFRKKGYASEGLKMLSKYIIKEINFSKKVIANIKKGNDLSLKSFIRAGYKIVKGNDMVCNLPSIKLEYM